MKQYSHDKLPLALAVAKNLSLRRKNLIFVWQGPVKSVSSMKYEDTTVIQVGLNSELAMKGGELVACFFKGKLRKIE